MYKREEANDGLVFRNMLYSGMTANLALQRKKGGREHIQDSPT